MKLSARDRALAHVLAVNAARNALEREYDAERPRSATLSRLHQEIGAEMKLAQVHAQLAVAAAVDDLRAELVRP
jgi:hypothetical protein